MENDLVYFLGKYVSSMCLKHINSTRLICLGAMLVTNDNRQKTLEKLSISVFLKFFFFVISNLSYLYLSDINPCLFSIYIQFSGVYLPLKIDVLKAFFKLR